MNQPQDYTQDLPSTLDLFSIIFVPDIFSPLNPLQMAPGSASKRRCRVRRRVRPCRGGRGERWRPPAAGHGICTMRRGQWDLWYLEMGCIDEKITWYYGR